MNTNFIRKLALLLPEKAGYPRELAAPATKYNVVQHCLSDPAFPWHFIQACLAAGKRLPVEAREIPLIYRAFRWRKRNTQEPIIAEAYSLTHPNCAELREVLDALLLCGDLSLEEIAGYLGLTLEVVETYETLWWNVRDRLQDRYFVARLCHPGTRLAARNGINSRRAMLLEAAHDAGAQEVLFLAGIRSETEARPGSEELAILEKSLLRQARLHLGSADPRDILQVARTMLVSGKKAKVPETPGAALQANMGAAIARELQARRDNYGESQDEYVGKRRETPKWEDITRELKEQA